MLAPPFVYKFSTFHYDPGLVRLITRYILREIAVPFALGLAVFTLVLLIARILKLVELVVSRGVPFIEVVKVFSYILPAFLEVTVPMALLLGVLPRHALSTWVALFLTALGLLATAILEIPPFWRVLRGAPLPRGGAAYTS